VFWHGFCLLSGVIDEETSMNLIVHAGNAKSCAMEAIAFAKQGRFEDASNKLQEGREAMTQAHHHQSLILEHSLDNADDAIPMLMIHAQDHLMSAITLLDLSQEFCDMYTLLFKNS
jgi:PTS system cellobiose-specific IIA component